MNNSKLEQQAVEAVQSSANALSPPLAYSQASVKTSDDYHWRVMMCIRACDGDHTAGLMLSQLLYWWPKKHAKHRGVKKSLSDWKGELMLGRRQVERINSVLVKLGFVEIYQAKWGHFKSPSTFYVLTDKAFALDKPLVQKEHMLSKAPAPKGHVVEQPLVQKVQVTENTYKPTENTKEQKALVTATAPVTTPPISKSKTASGQMQNLKATPDKAPQPVTEWKPTGVWERTASKFHPKAAVPLTQIQGKILRDVRKKLEALGFDSDLLVSYSVQHWYSVMFDIKGGSEIVPRPEFFSAHLASFVLYFNEHYVSEEQKQVEQAKQSKALAELAEIQAAKANAPAPAPKLSKWILALNAEKAANASGTA